MDNQKSCSESEKVNQSQELSWLWSVFLAAITLITLVLKYALPIRDGDIWWHMLYGKYFLENRTLIADHTIFSWSPSTNETLYCTWLPDILFYLVYKIFHLPGLFTIRYACLLTIIIGAGLYAKKINCIKYPFIWLVILVSVLMSYTAAFVKPEVLSFAFMTLIVWNWYHIRSGGEDSWKYCYSFPVIMVVWVNCHGAFVFGVIFLLLIAFGELLNTWFSQGEMLTQTCRKHLFFSLLLSAITPFINPYGYNYVVQLFFDVLPTASNNAYNNKIAAYLTTFDYQTPFQNFGLYADLAILLLLFQYYKNFHLKKIEWSSLLTNFVFAVLYTKYFRTTFYFAPVFCFSTLYLYSNTLGQQIQSKLNLNRVKNYSISILMVILSGFAIYNAYKTPEMYQWMGFGISETNPVEEAEFIKKYFPNAKIGNTYDQGAYLLWTLWPDNKVFFDSRHFPFKSWSDELFNDFQKGKNLKKFLNKYPCDLWLVSLRLSVPLSLLEQSPNWKRVFYGKNSMVFVRKNIPIPPNMPHVSSAISSLNSKLNAYVVFSVACNIKDWETADKLLGTMADKFSSKEMVEWGTKFKNGIKAYFDGDFKKTISLLSSLRESPIKTNAVLAISHQFLAVEAWKNKKLEMAMQHIRASWNLLPGNIYSAYNAGIIERYRDESENQNKNQNLKKPWYHYLKYFLDRVKDKKQFGKQREIAKYLTNGGDIFELKKIELIQPH
jgi:hypothetical protein